MARPRPRRTAQTDLSNAKIRRAEHGYGDGQAVQVACEPREHREERLGDEARKKYTLKNGAQIEGGIGLAYYGALQSLLQQEPQLFDALLAVVQGRPQDATPKAIAELTRAAFLGAQSGTVLAGMGDVLLSAYQETPEGLVLVNPFRFTSPEQAAEVTLTRDEGLDWLNRELRKNKGKGNGDPPARP